MTGASTTFGDEPFLLGTIILVIEKKEDVSRLGKTER